MYFAFTATEVAHIWRRQSEGDARAVPVPVQRLENGGHTPNAEKPFESVPTADGGADAPVDPFDGFLGDGHAGPGARLSCPHVCGRTVRGRGVICNRVKSVAFAELATARAGTAIGDGYQLLSRIGSGVRRSVYQAAHRRHGLHLDRRGASNDTLPTRSNTGARRARWRPRSGQHVASAVSSRGMSGSVGRCTET
jgi:hypothetical protein